jgi:dipeptidase D
MIQDIAPHKLRNEYIPEKSARADSRLVPVIQRIYEAQNGEAIKVEAIHAGLECGVFYELAEGLDMVSIGPDVLNAHSPEETLFLASIPKTWHLLERLLVSLEE